MDCQSTRCRLGSEVLLVCFVAVMVTGILTTLVYNHVIFIMWYIHSYAIASLRDDVRAAWPYIRLITLLVWSFLNTVTIVILVTILLKDVSLHYFVVLEQSLVSLIVLMFIHHGNHSIHHCPHLFQTCDDNGQSLLGSSIKLHCSVFWLCLRLWINYGW